MPDSPETRASLLVRLKDSADDAAWAEFTEIYRPLICRLARARGFQHADAEDLAQQVLTSVARAIGRWQAEPARARFRTWLRTGLDGFVSNEAGMQRTAQLAFNRFKRAGHISVSPVKLRREGRSLCDASGLQLAKDSPRLFRHAVGVAAQRGQIQCRERHVPIRNDGPA